MDEIPAWSPKSCELYTILSLSLVCEPSLLTRKPTLSPSPIVRVCNIAVGFVMPIPTLPFPIKLITCLPPEIPAFTEYAIPLL